MAVNMGKKKCRKAPVVWKADGAASMGPKPPALWVMKASRTSDMTSRKGAEMDCRARIDATPRQTMSMLRSQKPRKDDQRTVGEPASVGMRTPSMAAMD